MIVSCFFASLRIVCTGPSWLSVRTYSLSTLFPERNASSTAFRPSISPPSVSFFLPIFLFHPHSLSVRLFPKPFPPDPRSGHSRLSDTDTPSQLPARLPSGNL